MKSNKLFLIFALFMVLLCCFSAVSASEDVTDDAVAVSDDVTVDEVVSEVDSGDGSIATEDDESLESVDDSGNESLAVQDVEQVDDVDNTTLTAENENESDVNDTNSTLTAEVDDELSGQSHRLKSFNTLKTSRYSDILSFTNDEEFLTDSFNHIYVSVNGTGDGLSVDNPTSLTNAIKANIEDNTIIHISDGNYEVTTPITIKAKENITIMADNPGKVNISYKNTNKKIYLTLQNIRNFTFRGINFNYTYTLMTFTAVNVNGKFIYPTNIVIDKCTFDGNGVSVSAISSTTNGNRNLTISNCNFTSSNNRFLTITTNLADYMERGTSYILGDCVVNITNCIFDNCSTDAVYLSEPTDTDRAPNSVIKHFINNCIFYNTGLTIAVGTQKKLIVYMRLKIVFLIRKMVQAL